MSTGKKRSGGETGWRTHHSMTPQLHDSKVPRTGAVRRRHWRLLPFTLFGFGRCLIDLLNVFVRGGVFFAARVARLGGWPWGLGFFWGGATRGGGGVAFFFCVRRPPRRSGRESGRFLTQHPAKGAGPPPPRRRGGEGVGEGG